MKSIIIVLSLFVLVFAVAVPVVGADEEKKTEKKAELPELSEGYKAQETCPVMGGKITDTSYADCQGQRIYFCCDGCEDSFMKDSDKFFEQAAKDKVMFANVQTTCPVTGDLIDKKVFTYYKGRGIYFSSAESAEKFKADPDKYLKKLQGCTGKCCAGKKDHDHKHDDDSDHGHDHDHDH